MAAAGQSWPGIPEGTRRTGWKLGRMQCQRRPWISQLNYIEISMRRAGFRSVVAHAFEFLGARDEKLNIDAHRDVPSISASAWKVRAVAKRTHLPRQACHPATYPLQKPQRVGHPHFSQRIGNSELDSLRKLRINAAPIPAYIASQGMTGK